MELMVDLTKALDKADLNISTIITGETQYLKIINSDTLQEVFEYLQEIAFQICDFIDKRRTGQYSLIVGKIVDYINEHYASDISLDDIANMIHMNASYICRIIKKATGQSFLDILLNARIEKAKILLNCIDYKTYEIAEMVGINDSKYFSSVFKKTMGMTPTEYRNSTSLNKR